MTNLLVFSRTPKLSTLIHELMPGSKQVHVTSVHDAQQQLRLKAFDLCVIQPIANDGFAIRFALQLAMTKEMGILLLVKNEVVDQVLYQVMDQGIFVLGLPCQRQVLYQALCCLEASLVKIRKMSMEVTKLNKRIQDEKLIYRAKLLLIEQYHWTEEKAHHYIEHLAMDSGQKKASVAKMILEGGSS